MSNEEVMEEVAMGDAGNDTGGVASAATTVGSAVGGSAAGTGSSTGTAAGGTGMPLDADGLGHDSYGHGAFREDMKEVESARPIEVLQGVEMAVTVELGRTRMMVRDLLGIRVGSVIELDRQVGSNVDILVNGTLLAKGEVVVVDDEMGVRITDIARREIAYEER